MKTYMLEITKSADAKMDEAYVYILEKSQSFEIAEGVYQDYLETCAALTFDAGTIHEHPNKKLREMGLRRKNFNRHDYFVLFKIVDDTVQVTNVFHFKENYIVKL